MSWTDDPLSINVKYKAVHINELRSRIDALNAISCPTNNVTYDITDRTAVDDIHNTSNFTNHLVGNFVVHDLSEDGAVQNNVNSVHDSANLTSHDNGLDTGDDSGANSNHLTGVDTSLYIGHNHGDDGSAHGAHYTGNDASDYYSNLGSHDSSYCGSYELGNDATQYSSHCNSYDSGLYASALSGVNNDNTANTGGGGGK